ncbi:MAG: hypothetical protein JXA67_02390 [Micromonosporaceae bacterium]|nr:hypothetical protein [Micromonosporaceae bacterium]
MAVSFQAGLCLCLERQAGWGGVTGWAHAASRNFQRWPILTIAWVVNRARTPATATWREQIGYTAAWTKRRAAWIDTQWR